METVLALKPDWRCSRLTSVEAEVIKPLEDAGIPYRRSGSTQET